MIELTKFEKEQSIRADNFECQAREALAQEPPNYGVLLDLADEAASYMQGRESALKGRYAVLFSEIDFVLAEKARQQG